MPLKFVVDNLDAVPEGLRGDYQQAQDGKHYLQVEGAVHKDRLDEFRTNNVQLKKQLEQFADIDPVKAREAINLVANIDQKKLLDAGKVDEVVRQRVEAMKTDYETKLTNMGNDIQTRDKQLEVLIVDSSVRQAATQLGVLPTAVDDVILRAKTVFQVKQGNAIPFDSKGSVVYDVDGSTPLSINNWVKKLKADAPHLFQGTSGGGAFGGRGNGSMDLSKMSPTQKIAAGLEKRSS